MGIRGLDSIYEYNFRWRGLELVKGRQQVEFHEGIIDYIQVRPDIYFTAITGVETADEERIPVDLEFLVTVRVANPYKALFKAPSNWNENMMARLNAYFSGRISATKKLDDLLEWREDPEKIWQEFSQDPLISMLRNEWGLQIEENGIELRAVTPPPEYQAAAARRRQMELEAEGKAAQTVGAVIGMMAVARGKTPEEVKTEIEGDTELKKEFRKLAQDLIIRDMGIQGGAYLDIRVQGAGDGSQDGRNSEGGGFEGFLDRITERITKAVVTILAAKERMPKGKAPKEARARALNSTIRKCSKCGSEVRSNVIFCSNCGQRVM